MKSFLRTSPMNCSKQLIFIVPWESLCVSQWLNNIKYPTGKVQPPPSVWRLLWHPWGSNHRVHTICTYLIWSLSRESPLCLYNQKIQLLSTHAKKVKFTAGCRSLFLQLQIFLSFPFFSFFFFFISCLLLNFRRVNSDALAEKNKIYKALCSSDCCFRRSCH